MHRIFATALAALVIALTLPAFAAEDKPRRKLIVDLVAKGSLGWKHYHITTTDNRVFECFIAGYGLSCVRAPHLDPKTDQ